MAEHRANRDLARQEILKAANKARRRASWTRTGFVVNKPYTMRRIQQAVCVVRRQLLVKPEVLIAAGFAPTEAR